MYGNNLIRALYLQEERSPKLATGDAWSKYPAKNKEGLPYVANPDPVEHQYHDQYDFWSKFRLSVKTSLFITPGVTLPSKILRE